MGLIIQLATLAVVIGFGVVSLRKGTKIMASIDEVKADFAKFVADVKAKIDGLQAKIDAGGAVESADLDQLKTTIDEADAALNPTPAP